MKLEESKASVPTGFIFFYEHDHSRLSLLHITTCLAGIPRLDASIMIDDDMNIRVRVGDKFILKRLYSDICREALSLFSQMLNLMARVKHLLSNSSDEDQLLTYKENVIDSLEI